MTKPEKKELQALLCMFEADLSQFIEHSESVKPSKISMKEYFKQLVMEQV